MEKIDITITATLRQKIFYKTLLSFTKNMLTDQSRYRIILNVDPIGEDNTQQKILDVAKGFFKDIIYRFPDKPCFSGAVIWCWEQVTSKYILNLEDDWRLLVPINIDSMIEIMEKNPKLASLRLSKNGKPETVPERPEDGFAYYPKLSLNPVLLRGVFVRKVSKLMDPTLNPEKQLRCSKGCERTKYLCEWLHGVYSKEGLDATVRDIGRSWMDNTKFTKVTGFTNWEIKENE